MTDTFTEGTRKQCAKDMPPSDPRRRTAISSLATGAALAVLIPAVAALAEAGTTDSHQGQHAEMHMDIPAPAPGTDSAALKAEQPFLAENEAAMDKMMADMAAQPTGNIDADFVAMMIPHHQGAIDMAILQLKYGTNPKLKNIAQEIIVTQQQEIKAMRLSIGLPPGGNVDGQTAN
ncbi:DUF305 domain-containing protein [Paracoccus sp. Z330]|uniref:DUF305 domain-containing protein n=1 Tax=Paracoccus onchidii TaxID=3017813 RepID=A0ABT4ZJW7_9RHOB|nr:DUF305 domain-containing protein [Paracoccus onchidii]MDB6179613.1 DUF305 domain-containing protein [Paracoccus onchidii]